MIVLVIRNVDRPNAVRFSEIAWRAGTVIAKNFGGNRLKAVKRGSPDSELFCERQIKEIFSHREQTVTQERIDTVTGDHEKADVFARAIDLPRYVSLLLGPPC
jgi:hypothetical protein